MERRNKNIFTNDKSIMTTTKTVTIPDEEKCDLQGINVVNFGHNASIRSTGLVTARPTQHGNRLIVGKADSILITKVYQQFSMQYDNVIVDFKKISHNTTLLLHSETKDGITYLTDIEVIKFCDIKLNVDGPVIVRSKETGFAAEINGEAVVVVQSVKGEIVSYIGEKMYSIPDPNYRSPPIHTPNPHWPVQRLRRRSHYSNFTGQPVNNDFGSVYHTRTLRGNVTNVTQPHEFPVVPSGERPKSAVPSDDAKSGAVCYASQLTRVRRSSRLRALRDKHVLDSL